MGTLNLLSLILNIIRTSSNMHCPFLVALSKPTIANVGLIVCLFLDNIKRVFHYVMSIYSCCCSSSQYVTHRHISLMSSQFTAQQGYRTFVNRKVFNATIQNSIIWSFDHAWFPVLAEIKDTNIFFILKLLLQAAKSVKKTFLAQMVLNLHLTVFGVSWFLFCLK